MADNLFEKDADFPANPEEKAGYRLEFSDNFQGAGLDTDKWFPHYTYPSGAAERRPGRVTAFKTTTYSFTSKTISSPGVRSTTVTSEYLICRQVASQDL